MAVAARADVWTVMTAIDDRTPQGSPHWHDACEDGRARGVRRLPSIAASWFRTPRRRGRADFASRFLAEQLITFPRFVLSGGFRQAWREAGATTRA
jgi:hypothetical protein